MFSSLSETIRKWLPLTNGLTSMSVARAAGNDGDGQKGNTPLVLPDLPDDINEISSVDPFGEEQSKKALNSDKYERNPGRFEDLSKGAQETLSPEVFEGAKFEFARQVTEDLGAIHNITLTPAKKGPDGTPQPSSSNYAFGVVGTNSKQDSFIYARMTSEGNFFSRCHYGVHAEVDFRLPDSTSTFWLHTRGSFALSHLQAITKRLSLGTELRHYGQEGISVFSGGAAYRTKGHELSALLSSQAFANINYLRRVSDRIGLASSWMLRPSQMGLVSVWAAGWEYRMTSSVVRSAITSDWTVASVLEDTYLNGMVKLTLSANLDHVAENYQFGVGLAIQT